MPTRKDIKDSKYLDKADCEPAIKVTITECVEEDVSMENKPTRMKWVLYFREHQKGLVLNLTNWDRIESITKEPDSDNWTGAVITLYNDPTIKFGDEVKGGIRVWVPQVIPAGIEEAQQPPLTSTHVGDGPPPPNEGDVPPETDNPNWVGDNPPAPPNDGVPY